MLPYTTQAPGAWLDEHLQPREVMGSALVENCLLADRFELGFHILQRLDKHCI